ASRAKMAALILRRAARPPMTRFILQATWPAVLAVVALIAASAGPFGLRAAAQSSGPCASTRYDGASYVVCAFDARRDDIRLFWKGADNQVYGDFSRLASALAARGRSLRFAMNDGMFENDLTP